MKNPLKNRIFSIRPCVLIMLILGVAMLLGAILPDSPSRSGWLMQSPRDIGYVLMGMVLLYGSLLAFGHLRIHEVKKNPDDFSWKHIALVCTLLMSCALIISSVLG